ncbi:hypothetical protein KQX54_005192 [Cotesia glomerata]|uniref:THAP-type domain-containing protein n=1 Tax=Cotesia glomerata TaxID=32391 RepID=A0AAV7IZR5_COTGL|nr:hypothetical protein KQX54_005192 [Cotesia glomerata]
MWERVLKIGVNVTEHMVVCSLHFTKNDYFLPDQSRSHRYLKSDAIPSCNLPSATANKTLSITTDLESSIQDIEDVRNESKLDEPGPRNRIPLYPLKNSS